MKKIVFFIFFFNVYIIGKENNIKDIIEKADSYYSQKKYEEAIEFYKEALPLAIDIEDIIALITYAKKIHSLFLQKCECEIIIMN